MGDYNISPSLDGLQAIFLDLDGTIYLGGKLISGALDFLDRCGEKGIARFFLSNNSSRSTSQYRKKLSAFNIEVEEDEILLSTHDLLSWLGKNNVEQTYVVGTKGMCSMLEDVGINTASAEPQYVVLGYDTEVTYEKLVIASEHLHRGVPLVASHPDIVCPSPTGGLPDVGAFLDLFKATTGVDPAHICGKPNPDMILHKIKELGFDPARCAMVGDRLYTDMKMAIDSGVISVLVLSGEATRDDVVEFGDGIDLIVDSINALLR
jgi:HAD superfamily hydrolase (TIGR01450 family)